LLLLDTMFDFRKAAVTGGLFFFFTASGNCVPTIALSFAGERPLASPRTGGQRFAPRISNARCGAPLRAVPTVTARVPKAGVEQ